MAYLFPAVAGIITSLILKELRISIHDKRWWLIAIPTSVVIGFINAWMFQ